MKILLLLVILFWSVSAYCEDSSSVQKKHRGYTLEELQEIEKEVGYLYVYSIPELTQFQDSLREQILDELGAPEMNKEKVDKVHLEMKRVRKALSSHPDEPFSYYKECPAPDITEFKNNGAQRFSEDRLINSKEGKELLQAVGRTLLQIMEDGTWQHKQVRSASGSYGIETWVVDGKLWVKTVSRVEAEEWGLMPGATRYSDKSLCEYPRQFTLTDEADVRREM